MEKELPKNWVATELKNLAKIQSGGTPARSNKSFWNGNIPWVKISDLKEFYVSETKEFITEEGLKNSSTRIFPKGTILFTIFATIGKVGVLKIDAATNQAIAGITPSKRIRPQYLTFALIELSNEILGLGKGVAQKNINQTILKNTLISVPPLSEQKRIVTKLDALFASLATIKASLANIPQLLQNFRQQVLTQAVTGKLTEEWREGKDLGEWKEEVINNVIVSIKSGKNFQCPGYPVSGNNVGLVKISAVTWGTFDEKETKTVLDETKINPELFIKKEDFLISRANTIELVGSCLIVDSIQHKIMLSDKIWRVTFHEEWTKKFINFYLKSNKGRQEIQSRASGNQHSMRNLSQKEFKKITFLRPSLKEQQEIVYRVESLFKKADKIQEKYEVLKAQIEQLPQAILHKTFKGELVPQLESDGDAKDLLKEIETLKLAEKPKKKRK